MPLRRQGASLREICDALDPSGVKTHWGGQIPPSSGFKDDQMGPVLTGSVFFLIVQCFPFMLSMTVRLTSFLFVAQKMLPDLLGQWAVPPPATEFTSIPTCLSVLLCLLIAIGIEQELEDRLTDPTGAAVKYKSSFSWS